MNRLHGPKHPLHEPKYSIYKPKHPLHELANEFRTLYPGSLDVLHSQRMKLIGAILLSVLLAGCYYLTQGVRLAGVYEKAVPVGAALSDPSLAPEERELLDLVVKAKAFGVEKLGLVDNGNYSTYIYTEKNYLVDVISACKADSFDQYQFDYLFAGKLPYKGFFTPGEALKEAEALKAEGYDVYARRVEAFSSVGILKDPIMSLWKDYSKARIAEIVIHEQLHATVFTTKYPDTSENLATFVGKEGSLLFMKSIFGEKSAEYEEALSDSLDSKAYSALIMELHDTLAKIYSTDNPKDMKLFAKANAISDWKKRIVENYRSLFRTDSYEGIDRLAINNAYIATFLNYKSDTTLYERLFEKEGRSIKKCVGVMKSIINTYDGDPEKKLREYVGILNLDD
jgi:predicted aminopeptidase